MQRVLVLIAGQSLVAASELCLPLVKLSSKRLNPNLNTISKTSKSPPAIAIYFDFSMLRHKASIDSSGFFLIR